MATDEDGNAKPRHDPNLEPDLTEEEEEERRAKRAKLSAPVSDGISLYCAPLPVLCPTPCTVPHSLYCAPLPSGPTNSNASALWAERCVPLRVYRPV